MGNWTSTCLCDSLHSCEYGRFRCDDNSSGRGHAGDMPLFSCMDCYVFGFPFLSFGYTFCLSKLSTQFLDFGRIKIT